MSHAASYAPTNPPFKLIAKELRRGKVIPFLGAGVNFGERPKQTCWELNANFLPSGKELSGYLAELSNLTYDDPRDIEDLAKVASYYVDRSGERDVLRADLREIFNNEYKPCSIHTYLAEQALYYEDGGPAYPTNGNLSSPRKAKGTPLLIVTTNYDDLPEKAFRELGRPYDLVIYPTDRDDLANAMLWWKDRGYHGASTQPIEVVPNNLRIDLNRTNVIYKMHGSIDRDSSTRDSFVITEEDYVDFLSRLTTNGAIPSQFMSYFRRRRFLFLGYGLNDWNLRLALRNLRNYLGDSTLQAAAPIVAPELDVIAGDSSQKSWAIQYNPSALEVSLWGARRVEIYNQDINVFAQSLRDFAATLPVVETEI